MSLKRNRSLVVCWMWLALLFLALGPTGADLARAQGVEIQGQMKIEELLDRVDTLIRERGVTVEEQEKRRKELRARADGAIKEMQESEPKSARFRVAKSEWANVMAQLVHEKVVWSQQNVEQARALYGTLGDLLGMIEGTLVSMESNKTSPTEVAWIKGVMIDVGAHIGSFLYDAIPKEDSRSQAALRSMMLQLHQVKSRSENEEGRTGGNRNAYLIMYQQMRAVLGGAADMIATNRVLLGEAQAQGQRLEAEILRDLALNNIERLERHTRVLTGEALSLNPLVPASSDWDDFRRIEAMEEQGEAQTGVASAQGLDTKAGFQSLLERKK